MFTCLARTDQDQGAHILSRMKENPKNPNVVEENVVASGDHGFLRHLRQQRSSNVQHVTRRLHHHYPRATAVQEKVFAKEYKICSGMDINTQDCITTVARDHPCDTWRVTCHADSAESQQDKISFSSQGQFERVTASQIRIVDTQRLHCRIKHRTRMVSHSTISTLSHDCIIFPLETILNLT